MRTKGPTEILTHEATMTQSLAFGVLFATLRARKRSETAMAASNENTVGTATSCTWTLVAMGTLILELTS